MNGTARSHIRTFTRKDFTIVCESQFERLISLFVERLYCDSITVQLLYGYKSCTASALHQYNECTGVI